jgi:putative SOS response-associated peptidase YedK
MCGKFSAQLTWDEYCDLAGVEPGEATDAMDSATVLRTFAPMSRVPVLHLGPVRQRRITLMRWGWHNHKLADPMRGFSHLHARSEEIDRTPTWVEPFRDRRGVVFAKTFNIGEELPGGKIKQWVCSRADGAPMALAVIYSSWQLAQGKLTAFAMVTTRSCAPLDRKDDRMPAILKPEEVAMWIGEVGATPSQLKSFLRPFDGSLIMREQAAGKPRRADGAQAELF